MSKWEKVRLGDIFKVTSGGTPSKSKPEYYKNGSIQWIRTGDLKSKYITKASNSITEEALRNSSAKLFPIDTVLIAMYGATIGACSILAIEATTNQACAAFLPNKRVDSSYLYYFLCSKKNELIKLSVGGAQPNISGTILKGVSIPVPPLAVQKKIAQTLDAALELIALRKKQLAELDNLIKSAFYDMFGDPVANEKGWGVKKLGEVGELARGISKHRPRNDPKLLNGAYPLIQTGDVANAGLYINNYKQTYSEIGLQQSKIWNKGTLCITIAANIAKTSILNFSACFPDSIVGFKPNEFTNVIYINVWFSFFQKIIEEQAPESAQKNINLKILNDLDIVIPPIALQNQFAEIVTKIEEQKALVQKAIDESQYLFDSLMSEYFE